MSMELYALSDVRLNSIVDWQKAIDANRFALTLVPAKPIADLRGFLPIQLSGAQTGFECDYWDPRDILKVYSDVHFDHPWQYCLAFRWGADLKACLGAYMAAAAYAAATNGVVFDCEQGKVLTQQEAAQTARNIEAQLPLIEQTIRNAQKKFTPR